MVLAYHVVLSTYGFWLPNDPRGSWSDYVRSWELRSWGPATKVQTRSSVAGATHDARLRLDAKGDLRYEPVRFTGVMAQQIGRAFGRAADDAGYGIFAFAIMPDHVHLVLGRHRYPVEQVVRRLKQAGTAAWRRQVRASPTIPASPWARGLWKVYLNDARDVARAIAYVQENPVRAGLRRQRWSFVMGWEDQG